MLHLTVCTIAVYRYEEFRRSGKLSRLLLRAHMLQSVEEQDKRALCALLQELQVLCPDMPGGVDPGGEDASAKPLPAVAAVEVTAAPGTARGLGSAAKGLGSGDLPSKQKQPAQATAKRSAASVLPPLAPKYLVPAMLPPSTAGMHAWKDEWTPPSVPVLFRAQAEAMNASTFAGFGQSVRLDAQQLAEAKREELRTGVGVDTGSSPTPRIQGELHTSNSQVDAPLEEQRAFASARSLHLPPNDGGDAHASGKGKVDAKHTGVEMLADGFVSDDDGWDDDDVEPPAQGSFYIPSTDSSNGKSDVKVSGGGSNTMDMLLGQRLGESLQATRQALQSAWRDGKQAAHADAHVATAMATLKETRRRLKFLRDFFVAHPLAQGTLHTAVARVTRGRFLTTMFQCDQRSSDARCTTTCRRLPQPLSSWRLPWPRCVLPQLRACPHAPYLSTKWRGFKMTRRRGSTARTKRLPSRYKCRPPYPQHIHPRQATCLPRPVLLTHRRRSKQPVGHREVRANTQRRSRRAATCGSASCCSACRLGCSHSSSRSGAAVSASAFPGMPNVELSLRAAGKPGCCTAISCTCGPAPMVQGVVVSKC